MYGWHACVRYFMLGGFLLVASASGVAVPQTRSGTAAPAPSWVDAYFEAMTGVWIADNSPYRSDNEPIDAYGMEWKPGIGKKSLVGRLYAIRDGREVATMWEFREFWHAGESALLATQFGSDGTYGIGPHERRADGTMEMVQTFYPPAGPATRVAHRSELTANRLTTRSFDVQTDGTWKARRTYVWRRQRQD